MIHDLALFTLGGAFIYALDWYRYERLVRRRRQARARSGGWHGGSL